MFQNPKIYFKIRKYFSKSLFQNPYFKIRKYFLKSENLFQNPYFKILISKSENIFQNPKNYLKIQKYFSKSEYFKIRKYLSKSENKFQNYLYLKHKKQTMFIIFVSVTLEIIQIIKKWCIVESAGKRWKPQIYFVFIVATKSDKELRKPTIKTQKQCN